MNKRDKNIFLSVCSCAFCGVLVWQYWPIHISQMIDLHDYPHILITWFHFLPASYSIIFTLLLYVYLCRVVASVVALVSDHAQFTPHM